MKTFTLALNGDKQNISNHPDSAHPGLELKESVLVSSALRGDSSRTELQLAPTDLVELVFEDDTRWLCPPDSLEDIYPGSLTKNRDGETVFELPADLEHPDASRGFLGKSVLKLFNLFARKKVSVAMEVLVKELEEKQLATMSGLVQLTRNFELKKPEGLNTANPMVLFIHGTNSNTTGSFGELLGTELWNHITEAYGNNILAFQHETLSKSPLQNALELVKQLPANAVLHVITHSRGGLVGEILCRFSGASGIDTGFSKQEMNLLKEEDRKEDLEFIRQLQEVCPAKKFTVKKFIRVACPTSGTTILSNRLDYFFNISLNLMGLIPGFGASPLYVAMKNLLIAVIDQKNDADVLPGLEAMKPDSPFITVLNNQNSTVSIGDPVMAISGNCKMKLNLKALVIIASKLFFTEPNDLIVNTKSMYNGSKRKDKLQYFFDEGTDVDHFHYFKNKKTNGAILLALKSAGAGRIEGFTEHSRGTSGEAQRNAILKLDGGQFATGIPSGKKPIVVLLPGIMGSNLTNSDDLVWINYLSFLTGGLTRLAINESGIAAPSIVKTSYKKLGDNLQGDYDVMAFPFDWRISLKEAAAVFASRIEDLMKFNVPIKIIGHSMGGVLVRDFMVFHPATWKKLNESTGFRLIFLGSPLGGSFRINNVLFGEDDIISKISKIDLFHTKKKLLKMFSAFPGLLCLLPFNTDAENDFADMAVWNKMKSAFGDSNWPLPAQADLDAFKNYRDAVLKSKTIDFKNAVYIAGQDSQTPCGYRIDDTVRGKELVFLSTAEGDQSVTWEMGIPKSMIDAGTVYYVAFSHGALSNAPAIFNGIRELLAKGETGLLSKKRPVVRGGQKIFKRIPVSDFDLSPDGLENTLLGITESEEITANELPLKVKVSHGDLKYASYPVLAGHFKNDGILYAEKRIDALMQGILEERLRLGLYPGDIGTHEILINKASPFPGAIIIGLSEPDTLTAFELSRSVEQAIAKYLLIINGQEKTSRASEYPGTIGISALMIACAYGGLSVDSSVTAVLQGVAHANAKIRSLYGDKGRLVEEVEFIELYQDKALSCFYSVNRAAKDPRGGLNITPSSADITSLNGARKKMDFDQSGDWWNRITIAKEMNKKGEVRGMRFSISTGAAREDLRTIFTYTGVVEQLVESISTDNNWSEEKARAVFELMIPNDFKSRLKKHGNIIWVLDDFTAGFPWELLQDNNKGADPLCINAGMIRQLATPNSRIHIELAAENTALVVGDPELKGYLPQLPGALEEAKAVSALLNERQFKTTTLIRETGETIIPAFCSDYKIIHLAGHGLFDSDPDNPSGMVIGKKSFLTTAEIAQMSVTPELVFVNCCFLGKTDGVAEEYFQSRFKLAANIGTQLINNGVKAVIVAGWAVDDGAALLFSRKFYEYLFEGKAFGVAVKMARQQVYEAFGRKNTWGAYQCYGDPYYKITRKSKGSVDEPYVIPAQAEIDLSNLRSVLSTGELPLEAAKGWLDNISAKIDDRSIRNAAITELEAYIYKELGLYEKAIEKFRLLLNYKNATYSFTAIEQYCNLRAKQLAAKMEKKKNIAELEEEFAKVMSDLEALLHLSPSAERYNLVASTWKRKLVLYKKNREKTLDVLMEAAKNYSRACRLSKNESGVYAYTNWITLENLLVLAGVKNWDGKPGSKPGDEKQTLPAWKKVQDTINAMISEREKGKATDDYWTKIEVPNLRLCYWMLEATRDKKIRSMPDSSKLIGSYLSVWKMSGTRNEKDIELQHLGLITEALKLIRPRHFMIGAITELKDKLAAEI